MKSQKGIILSAPIKSLACMPTDLKVGTSLMMQDDLSTIDTDEDISKSRLWLCANLKSPAYSVIWATIKNLSTNCQNVATIHD